MDGVARLRLLHAFRAFRLATRRLRAWRDADGLLASLASISDSDLRLHRLAEYLKTRSAEQGAWTISRLCGRVAAGDRRAQEVCLGVLDVSRLSRVLGADTLNAVHAALEREGDPSAGLFVTRKAPNDVDDTRVGPRPTEPIGYRISLARCPTPKVVDRLLFDPDPRVVRTILGNPRLTEAEVVKLAASRRATPQVLDVIAQDDRWIARYSVRVALVNNPGTPLPLVLGLLPYLLHGDLRAVATASPRAIVRARATSLLSSRGGL